MKLDQIECAGGGPLDGAPAPRAIVDDGEDGLAQYVVLEHGDGTIDVYECEISLRAAHYEYRGRITTGEFHDLQNP